MSLSVSSSSQQSRSFAPFASVAPLLSQPVLYYLAIYFFRNTNIMAIMRSSAALVLAALAPSALANILINNWCGVGVSLVQSHNGGCDFGADGRCVTEGSAPWAVGPGTGGSIINLPLIVDGAGTSIKISKDGVGGILQYEYAVATGEFGGMYWDLSDLDGSGAGLVGTPFAGDNVKVTPTGNGAQVNTCVTIRCAAGTTCLDSYQHPDDPNTKYCPADTGDMWLDLCMPQDLFVGGAGRLANDNFVPHEIPAQYQWERRGLPQPRGHSRSFMA